MPGLLRTVALNIRYKVYQRFRDHCSNVEHWLCKVRQSVLALHINSGFSNGDRIFLNSSTFLLLPYRKRFL